MTFLEPLKNNELARIAQLFRAQGASAPGCNPEQLRIINQAISRYEEAESRLYSRTRKYKVELQ